MISYWALAPEAGVTTLRALIARGRVRLRVCVHARTRAARTPRPTLDSIFWKEHNLTMDVYNIS